MYKISDGGYMFTLMPAQCIFIVLLQPTNAQLYITILSLHIKYTPTCFNIYMSLTGRFTFVPCQVT